MSDTPVPAVPDVDALAEELCANRRPGRGPCVAHRSTAEAVLATGVFEAWREQIAVEAKLDALREARAVITCYLATAEKWRYDRVCWAFAVMLGEIPEDSPEPLSPADEAEIARRTALAPKGPADEWIH